MMSATHWNAGYPEIRAADLSRITPRPPRTFDLPDVPGDGPDGALSRSDFQNLLHDLISPVAAPTGIRRHQPGKHYRAEPPLKRTA